MRKISRIMIGVLFFILVITLSGILNGGSDEVYASSNSSKTNTSTKVTVPFQKNDKFAIQASVLPEITRIDGGYGHTCVLTSRGEVKCWGTNGYGQLGIQNLVPVDVPDLSSGIIAITTGDYHTCVLTNIGSVKCLGWNEVGQLGDGTTTDRAVPVDVVGLSSGVVAIFSGYEHTCALLSDGSVKCWGKNSDGQLGDGTKTDSSTPVDVIGLPGDVSALALGGSHTCALMDDGSVKCWGDYFLADTSSLSGDVEAITSGWMHSCALIVGGSVKCWGQNGYGQLGDGTTTNRDTPVDVVGLSSGVTAINSWGDHTCVVMEGGGVKCWGINENGQLGDGTTINRNTPVDVVGLSSVAVVTSAGHFNTCAIMNGGGVKCWGLNQYGQIGDGTTIDQLTPVDVTWLSLTNVNPGNANVGSGDTQISVSGTDFNPNDVILVDGTPRNTTYMNDGSVTAMLTSSDLSTVKSIQISVQNLGFYESNSLPFNVYTFADVPPTHIFWRYIEGFYAEGITTGCSGSPMNYCPDNPVTRAAMAVFLLRAKNGADYQPPAATGIFTDLPVTGKEWMKPWVEEFYREGITTGCSADPLQYCPENSVTRAAMAVFLLRAKYGADYQPPAATGIFADLPVPGKEWMEPWVEQFYREGITTGCGVEPLRYCPEDPVKRQAMAVFIDRAFGIPQIP